MVAMPVVGMVQVAFDQVIDVVAVRDRRMATARAVAMRGGMPGAVMGSTSAGIGGVDFDHVLIVVAFVRKVQAAIVQIIDMVLVAHGHMSTAGAVDMLRVFVNLVIHRL